MFPDRDGPNCATVGWLTPTGSHPEPGGGRTAGRTVSRCVVDPSIHIIIQRKRPVPPLHCPSSSIPTAPAVLIDLGPGVSVSGLVQALVWNGHYCLLLTCMHAGKLQGKEILFPHCGACTCMVYGLCGFGRFGDHHSIPSFPPSSLAFPCLILTNFLPKKEPKWRERIARNWLIIPSVSMECALCVCFFFSPGSQIQEALYVCFLVAVSRASELWNCSTVVVLFSLTYYVYAHPWNIRLAMNLTSDG